MGTKANEWVKWRWYSRNTRRISGRSNQHVQISSHTGRKPKNTGDPGVTIFARRGPVQEQRQARPELMDPYAETVF